MAGVRIVTKLLESIEHKTEDCKDPLREEARQCRGLLTSRPTFTSLGALLEIIHKSDYLLKNDYLTSEEATSLTHYCATALEEASSTHVHFDNLCEQFNQVMSQIKPFTTDYALREKFCADAFFEHQCKRIHSLGLMFAAALKDPKDYHSQCRHMLTMTHKANLLLNSPIMQTFLLKRSTIAKTSVEKKSEEPASAVAGRKVLLGTIFFKKNNDANPLTLTKSEFQAAVLTVASELKKRQSKP